MSTQALEAPPQTSDRTPMTHYFVTGEVKALCGVKISRNLGPAADGDPVDCVCCAEIVRGWGYSA